MRAAQTVKHWNWDFSRWFVDICFRFHQFSEQYSSNHLPTPIVQTGIKWQDIRSQFLESLKILISEKLWMSTSNIKYLRRKLTMPTNSKETSKAPNDLFVNLKCFSIMRRSSACNESSHNNVVVEISSFQCFFDWRSIYASENTTISEGPKKNTPSAI